MTIDLHGITTKAGLHALLKAQLHFPDWYGPSWDALWDQLLAGAPLPAELRLLHWQEFAEACPRDMEILRRISRDYAEARPGKQLVLG